MKHVLKKKSLERAWAAATEEVTSWKISGIFAYKRKVDAEDLKLNFTMDQDIGPFLVEKKFQNILLATQLASFFGIDISPWVDRKEKGELPLDGQLVQVIKKDSDGTRTIVMRFEEGDGTSDIYLGCFRSVNDKFTYAYNVWDNSRSDEVRYWAPIETYLTSKGEYVRITQEEAEKLEKEIWFKEEALLASPVGDHSRKFYMIPKKYLNTL